VPCRTITRGLTLLRTPRNVLSFSRVVLARAFRGFHDARGFDLASSLAFSSLLSFVPLSAAVTILTSTLFGDSGTGFFRIIRAFVPGASRELVNSIRLLTERAHGLSAVVSIFFLVTSVEMFFVVEGAVNAVWGTTKGRSILRRIGLALVVIILGPVGAGIVMSLVLETGAPISEIRFSGAILATAAFGLLYRFVPRSHVRWGPAFVAGGFAGTSMLLLRYGFARGVGALQNINKVYGSISFAVIFVLAIGFAWGLILFGVALGHAVQFRKELLAHDEPEQEAKSRDVHDDAVALLLRLTAVWLGDRKASVPLDELVAAAGLPEPETKARMKKLCAAELAVQATKTTWRLARPPEEISLYAAARAFGGAIPRPVPAGDDETSASLRRLYRQVALEERSVLQGISLRDLYQPRV
jgi:membrane protein